MIRSRVALRWQDGSSRDTRRSEQAVNSTRRRQSSAGRAPSRSVKHDRGGLRRSASLFERHDVVEPREGLDLAPPFRRIGQKRDERRRRGASGVQSSCKNSGTMFSPSTRLARMTLASLGLIRATRATISSMNVTAIGGDRRHAGKRQFERHRAGCGERRPRGSGTRPISPPARRRCAARPASRQRRRGRAAEDAASSAARAPSARPGARTRAMAAPKMREQPADLARAAARQDQDKRRIGTPAPRLVGVRTQIGQALDQRMADIDAGRAAEPPMRRRLERQDRQHAIDIGAHGARAPGPPGPDRRRHVVDDRN